MSVVKCLESKLPDALLKALEGQGNKAGDFVGELILLMQKQSWSIFNPIGDIRQLENDMQKAAKVAGIDWSTIAEIVISVAKSVIGSCIGIGDMNLYADFLHNNPTQAKELNEAIIKAVSENAKSNNFPVKDNEVNKYLTTRHNIAVDGCILITW